MTGFASMPARVASRIEQATRRTKTATTYVNLRQQKANLKKIVLLSKT